MKTTILLATLAFLGICGVFAFVAWCGGYNFDCRYSDVGFGVAMTFFLAGSMAVGVIASRQ